MFREWVGIFALPVICVPFLSFGCRLSGPEPEGNSGDIAAMGPPGVNPRRSAGSIT
jgi:hypothetical protein